MKNKITTIIVFTLFLFSIQSSVAQQTSVETIVERYEITFYSEFKGQKLKLKLSNLYYSIGDYNSTINNKPLESKEKIFLSITSEDIITKEFLKIFEPKAPKINGYIEIKDSRRKMPTRKLEFLDAEIVLTESFSSISIAEGANNSITIYTDILVIDGISIFSKQ